MWGFTFFFRGNNYFLFSPLDMLMKETTNLWEIGKFLYQTKEKVHSCYRSWLPKNSKSAEYIQCRRRMIESLHELYFLLSLLTLISHTNIQVWSTNYFSACFICLSFIRVPWSSCLIKLRTRWFCSSSLQGNHTKWAPCYNLKEFP